MLYAEVGLLTVAAAVAFFGLSPDAWSWPPTKEEIERRDGPPPPLVTIPLDDARRLYELLAVVLRDVG